MIQIYALYDFNTYWRKPCFFCTSLQMFTQQATAGFFEVHSQSRPAFMAMDGDKSHWLLIHSLILMCDCSFTVGQFSQCTIDHTIHTRIYIRHNPFVVKMYVYLVAILSNTDQIQALVISYTQNFLYSNTGNALKSGLQLNKLFETLGWSASYSR